MITSPPLVVEFSKRNDGATVLRCVRADGSAVWQRHEGRTAYFFPFHDLTHFAVEQTLAFHHGFFGLIADGWEITDTEGKGTRGPLPREALVVEQLVGLFDRERIGGALPLSADAFNEQCADMLRPSGLEAPIFTDSQLVAVRQRVDELHAQWAALEPRATLALTFERAALVS